MPSLFPCLRAVWCLLLAAGLTAPAVGQIAGPVNGGEKSYRASGQTDQPFTVEVVGCRRTTANVLLMKLAVTNRGAAPLTPRQDFSGDGNPTDDNKISAVYVVDPNGRRKYTVLRDAQNAPLCSVVQPPIAPGETRNVFAQFAAPPTTSSAVDVYFPKASPVLGVPMGLPQAGEPVVPGAEIVGAAGLPTPVGLVPAGPSTDITEGAPNNAPNVYTNQTNPVLPNSSMKGVGTVQSANSTVPFTVDVLSLNAPNGKLATLKLAVTNNGSGNLEAAGQFTGSIASTADSQTIAGVYLVDPVSKQRFEVMRGTAGQAAASKIDPAFSPGERRMLEAQFSALPAAVKSVYVYFPHATAIADVPVTR